MLMLVKNLGRLRATPRKSFTSIPGVGLFRQRVSILKDAYSITFRNSSTTAWEEADDPTTAGAGYCPTENAIKPTQLFKVKVTTPSAFTQQLDNHKAMNSSKLNAMIHEYEAEVRPLLISKCLILPHSLKHSSTAFIHYQTHLEKNKRPTYCSSFDLMIKKNALTPEAWDQCVQFIILSRTYIVEDWTSTYGNIESLVYDYGVVGPPDGELYFRGECDASFCNGKADLSFILWDKNQVCWTEVVKGVDCDDSTVAEILAALLLLMRCIELQETHHKLKRLSIYTDSKTVVGVINGDYTITFNNNNRDEFLALRSLPCHFDKLVCVWKERSLNFMADYILKGHDFVGNNFSKLALEIWGPNIRGVPIFRIVQSKEARFIMENFKNHIYNPKVVTISYVKAKLEEKFNISLRIIETLNPKNIKLVIRNFKNIANFQIKLDSLLSCIKTTDVSTVVVNDTIVISAFCPVSKKGSLCLVFEAAVPENYQGWFTVVLAEPSEVEDIKLKGARELDAMFYIFFRGVWHTRIQENHAKLIKQGMIKEGSC